MLNLEFANRICPNCKNPNHVAFLGDCSKAYKYRCMNCNHYFNDTEMVAVTRCKNCKHGVKPPTFQHYPNLTWCNRYLTSHNDEWFCADGEQKET